MPSHRNRLHERRDMAERLPKASEAIEALLHQVDRPQHRLDALQLRQAGVGPKRKPPYCGFPEAVYGGKYSGLPPGLG